MIGTLIGLVGMLSQLDDFAGKIGEPMAVALLRLSTEQWLSNCYLSLLLSVQKLRIVSYSLETL